MGMLSYASTQNILAEYEENNLRFYTDNQEDKLVMRNTESNQLLENMRYTVEKLRNPFTDLYHWIKGEIYDLNAFSVAIKERATVQQNIKDIKKKIETTKSDIDSVSQGKKTMGTLFKNTGDVGSMQNSLEAKQRDLEAQIKLLDVMSLYLSRKVLPLLKKEKLALYSRVLQQFHVVEINNAHQQATFWSSLMKEPIVQNASRSEI
uniref:Uncharacterized protein n=1 Tax=Favella ehrenbergii TaxID=182087 RepID=A0A7S3HYU8_9SPIT|mmetsp:Transcript_20199/g.24958  ORF Transcript_20199/g.24958 Transcript_20199/m.24958 type:complete len:206 (+) Transcript_20199:690-1307(+)